MLLLVMAAIFVFSSQGTAASEDVSDVFAGLFRMKQLEESTRVSNQPLFFGLTLRKMAHIFLFTLLGFCMFQTLEGWKRRFLFTIGFSYIYAVLDEIHQQLIGRHGRWQDTLIDLTGILIGLGLALLLRFLWRRVPDGRR